MFAGIHTRTIWSLIESLYSGEIMGIVKLNSYEKKEKNIRLSNSTQMLSVMISLDLRFGFYCSVLAEAFLCVYLLQH